MHVDVCYKPWSAEFDKIAGSISGLKIITNIYASYVNQLNGFEQIDDWKKQFELKVGYPMGPLRAGMIQDRLTGISRQEYY